MDGFVFFRLRYFDYSDLQLFAIFIFEVDFSETYLMTTAEKLKYAESWNIFVAKKVLLKIGPIGNFYRSKLWG